MAEPITTTLLILSALGTANSVVQQKKAQAFQQRAADIQQASEQAKAQRMERMAQRKARIRRAQIAQAAVNTGSAGSSGEAAAFSAARRGADEQSSQLLGNQIAASAIGANMQRAARKTLHAGISREVGNTATSVLMNPNARQGLQDFFGTS